MEKIKAAASGRFGRLLILAAGYAWFFLLEGLKPEPVFWAYWPLDDAIPFISQFIIPYVLWYFYTFGPLFWYYFHDDVLFARLSAFLSAGMFFSCLVYSVFPNGQQLRPESVGGDIFSQMCAALYAIDTPTNSFPSLHIIFSIGVHTVIMRDKRAGRAVKLGSLALCVLICLSTMFVKQHSVVCVLGGVVVAAALYPIVYRREIFRKKAIISN